MVSYNWRIKADGRHSKENIQGDDSLAWGGGTPDLNSEEISWYPKASKGYKKRCTFDAILGCQLS